MRFISIVTVLILAACTVPAAVTPDFSRYEIILKRKPFGELPAPPSPARPARPQPPPFVKDLRMCAMTESDFGIRVGFINIRSRPQKSYFLYVGESEDGIELVDADYDEERALLRKGSEQHWIYMSGKSGGSSQPGPTVSKNISSSSSSRKLSYAQRLRRRREALAERNRRKREMPRLTGEELTKHLSEYNLELIRAGGEKGPPLPIPLTPEQDAQLVEEGVLPPL